MNLAPLLFTIVGLGAVAGGLALAAEPPDQPRPPAPSASHAQPTGDRSADEGLEVRPWTGRGRADGKASIGRERPGRAGEKGGDARLKPVQPSPWRPGQKPVGGSHAKGAGGANSQPPALNMPRAAVKEGSATTKLKPLHAQPVLSPIVKPAARQPLPVAPGPGRGASAIGGATFSPARNEAVLNGSGMKHKP